MDVSPSSTSLAFKVDEHGLLTGVSPVINRAPFLATRWAGIEIPLIGSNYPPSLVRLLATLIAAIYIY